VHEEDKNGKTNACKMVEALGSLATKPNSLTVNAFKALREVGEPTDSKEDTSSRDKFMIRTIAEILRGTMVWWTPLAQFEVITTI
jgi:hypothetical protein